MELTDTTTLKDVTDEYNMCTKEGQDDLISDLLWYIRE